MSGRLTKPETQKWEGAVSAETDAWWTASFDRSMIEEIQLYLDDYRLIFYNNLMIETRLNDTAPWSMCKEFLGKWVESRALNPFTVRCDKGFVVGRHVKISSRHVFLNEVVLIGKPYYESEYPSRSYVI